MKLDNIRLVLKQLPLLRLLLRLRKNIIEKRLREKRAIYIEQLKKIMPPGVSIVSSNCFSGRIMQDLNMEYNSPTLGLWIMPDDFAFFCNNIHACLKSEVRIREKSKNEYGEYKRLHPRDHFYPVGSIDGKVEIHFLHYKTAAEAVEKWKRRASRVNYDKMLLIGMEQNNCCEADIKRFNDIPYGGKLFFTAHPYPYESTVYISEFKKMGHVGDPYKDGDIFYRYLIEWLTNNKDKIGAFK